MRALNRCINMADFRALAQRRISSPVVDFVDDGAEDEATRARNRAFFTDWSLVPNQMRSTSRKCRSMAIDVITGRNCGFGEAISLALAIAGPGDARVATPRNKLQVSDAMRAGLA